jgi:diadenylate cyclase
MNILLSFIESIRWQDLVDVLLNSYILFRFYVLFRGTVVLRVLAGIALLWVFQRIAVGLGLIVTSWAMQGIIAGAALIIIIVFRNEIRNVLQTKNLRALLWGVPQKSVSTPIDAIIEAVYDLARRRIGALIVIPGKEDLQELIKGGVRWDGIVSKEMLLSVFWNGNPVHDGAVTIQDNRITRVGTILPLSLRDDFPRHYGTRHRAAAGLAEQSDGFVIVVSEERGQVVAAKGNDFIPIDDNVTLRRALTDHLGAARQSRQGRKRERRELVVAATICLFCMAGVWFSFARGMETLISLEVPLEYLNRDPRMQIVSTSANTVRLHLSGSSALISSLRPYQVKAQLDLSKAVSGLNSFALSEENILLPPGLWLSRIEPPEIQVALDMPVNKELPVQVDWVGALPDGYILESVSVVPDSVMVVGAQRTLDQIDTIYTEKVRLENLQGSGHKTVSLTIEPSSIKIVEGYKDKVDVRFTIRRRAAP